MNCVRYRDRIYVRHEGQLFVWEPTWDSFRPIHALAWDGTNVVEDDTSYTRDIWSPTYGYGSLQEVCRTLTRTVELGDATPLDSLEAVWDWCRSPRTWVLDRGLVCTPCAPRTRASWAACLAKQGWRRRTLRTRTLMRQTRRLRL